MFPLKAEGQSFYEAAILYLWLEGIYNKFKQSRSTLLKIYCTWYWIVKVGN